MERKNSARWYRSADRYKTEPVQETEWTGEAERYDSYGRRSSSSMYQLKKKEQPSKILEAVTL